MPGVLIIGFGNPVRSDDGLGYRAAEALSSSISAGEAEVVACHQLNIEMAERVAACELVLFLDVRDPAAPPSPNCAPQPGAGSAAAFLEEAIEPELTSEAFSHHLTPAALLGFAEMLFGGCPRGILLSAPGVCFDFGEELSPAVAEVLPAICSRVRMLVEEHASWGGRSPTAG